ncbi:MAG: exodeoxyribonuclease VII large subunit, partial [Wenzhouxiangellaceae bacterium]
WPAAQVQIYATAVQGEQAVPELLSALDRAEREARADVLILARGGGSLEDLWAFNDERLARRIAALEIPLVSGVGHETDFTIADFVADLRAATPTAAAEAVTPDGPALLRQVRNLEQRLTLGWTRVLQRAWQQVDQLDRRLNAHQPRRWLQTAADRLEQLLRRSRRAMHARLQSDLIQFQAVQRRLVMQQPEKSITLLAERTGRLHQRLVRAFQLQQERKQQRLAAAARALDAVSPLAILGRGYALIEDDQGRLLSRREDFSPGQTIHTRVRDVRVTSEVREISDAEPPAVAPEAPNPLQQ